ncbi:MAG: RteC domain-containing protein [Rikenellaceae bacterium]
MNKQIFDAFAQKIADTIDGSSNNEINLSDFKNEYLQILNDYSQYEKCPITVMRVLGIFRIELDYLIKGFKSDKEIYEQLVELCSLLIALTDWEIAVVDKMLNLKQSKSTEEPNLKQNHTDAPFQWTDSKTDLVELLRAVLCTRSINDGNVKIKEFIPYIGKLFNVDLTGHSSLFNDIVDRAGYKESNYSRTTYLRKITEALNRDLEVLDNKQRKR